MQRMAARETGLLMVVVDVTINGCTRLDSEVCRSILCSAHIQPNTAKLIRRGFPVLPTKHTVKTKYLLLYLGIYVVYLTIFE